MIVSFGPITCGAGRGSWPEVFSTDGYDRGRKFSATSALGMTDTMRGSKEARRTVFSLLFRNQYVCFQRGAQIHIPGMADTNNMVDITQNELEQFVG